MQTFADRVKTFNRALHLDAELPAGIGVLNPFREEGPALELADRFYEKFYADNNPRRLILGINPGRHGGGLTGVPFTDFKRLRDPCGIEVPAKYSSHEPSSEFVYRVVKAMDGPELFYKSVYINSVCPLGFIKQEAKGRTINYNYYDNRQLEDAVTPFVVRKIREQIALGCHTDFVVVLGKANAAFLGKLNTAHRFFREIREVPHPRYIIQYRRRYIDGYISEYIKALTA